MKAAPQRDGARFDAERRESETMAQLRLRLREAEETLDAIRNGEVDAVVVGGASGQQVYTLENADRPYRVLIEQMQEGAITLARDGTLLYCNQRFATLLGVEREQLMGHLILDRVAGADVPVFERLLAQADGSGRTSELLLVQHDGHQVPVNVSAIDLRVDERMPHLICCVVTDLTNSRQRSHELTAANAQLAREIDERRRAEESLDVALDAAGMGSWDLDLTTNIVRRSRRYGQIFGEIEHGDHSGLEMLLAPFIAEDRPTVAAAFAVAQRSGSIEFEKRILRDGDSAVRWVHVKGRTQYANERPVRISGVVSDVTERRLVQQQLHQAQKMEAIGQLTGGMAHDFNNLLMVIGGNIDLLESRLGQDSRSVRYLTAARQGVERGATLNQQLLAFARRQDLDVQSVCIDELLATFEGLLRRAVGEAVTVKVQASRQRWLCKTDPHQFETAILNLAINARDAMPEGGALALSTEHRVIDAQVAALHGAEPGSYIVAIVTDTGIGIAAEALGRVFEPFFTTKDVGKGTGLGLSQVYGFAKQSGGFVAIESELGAGTSFQIYLPATEEASLAPAAQKDTPQVRGHGVILVVEDDDNVREVTCELLRGLGYDVLEAASARAALAFVERDEPIDLVFSDVIMPGGMSGLDLVRQLKACRQHLPVLLSSGYTAQQFGLHEAMEGVELLRKPYSLAALSSAVERLAHRA
ncbi:MAG TPA: ATP-binding protein [Dokdonella sp.]